MRTLALMLCGLVCLLAGGAPASTHEPGPVPASPPGAQAEAAVSTNPPPAHPPAETNQPPGLPSELDRALRESQEVLASTNLTRADATEQALRLESFHTLLETARQQRRDRNLPESRRNLVNLLETNAPVELHRSALLELALVEQEARNHMRSIQVYAQYLQRFREDPNVPEVILRQGLLYREMGAPTMALSKFYSVMNCALTAKTQSMAYYERLVLQAQTEIADTYYLDGKFEEAADFFTRLLKLDNPQLNREEVMLKLIRSRSAARRHSETLAQARVFVDRFPDSAHVPEVRFLIADALKRLGRTAEAVADVLDLMQDQRRAADGDGQTWLHWQQRTGNMIANELYEEANFAGALEVYLRLAALNIDPRWRLPAWYQAGLIYERLKQPEKAAEMYDLILGDARPAGDSTPSSSLALITEMARWRKERLDWRRRADLANQQLSQATGSGKVSEKQ